MICQLIYMCIALRLFRFVRQINWQKQQQQQQHQHQQLRQQYGFGPSSAQHKKKGRRKKQ